MKSITIFITNLVELQNHYQFKTDKNSTHSYLETYDKLFNDYKHTKINLLEIGVLDGGSLELWNKYFTPNSNIYGLEVYVQRIPEHQLSLSNVHILYKDVNFINDNFLQPIQFDIIIDDGTHYLKDQVNTFEKLKNRLTPGGVYVIEDLQPDAYQHFTEYCIENKNCHIIDLRSIKDRYDDLLFVYRNDV